MPDPLDDQHLALAAEAAAVLFLGSRCLDHRAHPRFAPLGNRGRLKKTTIVALARTLLVALWKYVTAGVVIEGAVMKRT